MSTTRSGSRKARATDPRWRSAALLLCAHGVRGEAGVAHAHARAIAALDVFAEVKACALHGEPRLEDVLAGITAKRTYLVPLLMAEGRTSELLRARALAAAASRSKPLALCRPLGSHPALSDLIAAVAQRTCRARDWAPSKTGLVLIGHGTPRHARSRHSLWRHGARIAETQDFAEVRRAFLDDVPSVPEALRARTAAHTVAVGFFADAGPHGADDVQEFLVGPAREVVYAGPVGCDPGFVDLILDQVRQTDAAALVA